MPSISYFGIVIVELICTSRPAYTLSLLLISIEANTSLDRKFQLS